MTVELPNHQEVAQIAGYAMVLPERTAIGELEWATSIAVAPRQPWLAFTFTPVPPYPTDEGLDTIALWMWRFSLAVHDVDEHGAVIDPALTPERFAERFALTRD